MYGIDCFAFFFTYTFSLFFSQVLPPSIEQERAGLFEHSEEEAIWLRDSSLVDFHTPTDHVRTQIFVSRCSDDTFALMHASVRRPLNPVCMNLILKAPQRAGEKERKGKRL